MQKLSTQPTKIVAPMQFRIKERADGTWQWRLFDEHGNLIANCVKPYPGKGPVLDAIELVQKSAGAIVLESPSLRNSQPHPREQEHQPR